MNSNKHKQSASQGDHQIQKMALHGQNQQPIQTIVNSQFQNNGLQQKYSNTSQNQQNMSNNFNPQKQKTQRQTYSNNSQGLNTSANSHMHHSRETQGQKQNPQIVTSSQNPMLQEYKQSLKQFNQRQSIGAINSSTPTPISAFQASFTRPDGQGAPQGQFSGIQQPKILHNQLMRSSVNTVKHQYNGKENMDVSMRSTSGGPTNTNSGSMLASRNHNNQSSNAMNNSRNFFSGQQNTQQAKQQQHAGQTYLVNQQNNGSSSGIGPSLYSQQNPNYSINNQKYALGQTATLEHLNKTSTAQSFLRTANNLQSYKGRPSQQEYRSNDMPIQEITAVANGIQNSLANSYMNQPSSTSNKQAQIHKQLGSRLSHMSNNAGGISSQNFSQKSNKQTGQDSSQCSGIPSGSGSNRIPQPSIINSATGNMNQMMRQQSPKNQEPFNGNPQIENVTSYHSQQQQIKQQPVVNQANGATRQQIQMHQNIQAPMIIDKKFNLSGVTSNPSLVQNPNVTLASATNQRFASRENTTTTQNNQQMGNISMVHQSKMSQNMKQFEQMNTSTTAMRTSSQNMFKRMRTGGGTAATTNNHSGHGSQNNLYPTQRYSMNKVNKSQENNQQNAQAIRDTQQMRERHDMDRSVGSSGSFVMKNKYTGLHKMNHESNRAPGGLVPKKQNQSGADLNTNLQRVLAAKHHHNPNVPNTQRSERQQNGNSSTIGRTSGRSSLKTSQGGMATTNQSSHTKPVSQFGHQKISGVTQKILKEHQEKLNDKENKQRLSNKPSSHSQGKTGSTLVRQSIVNVPGHHHKNSNRNSNQMQNSSLGIVNNSQKQQSSNKSGQNNTIMSNGNIHHEKSKNSENERSSSHGANNSSHRHSSSQHHTNRSQNGQSSSQNRHSRITTQGNSTKQHSVKGSQSQLTQQTVDHIQNTQSSQQAINQPLPQQQQLVQVPTNQVLQKSQKDMANNKSVNQYLDGPTTQEQLNAINHPISQPQDIESATAQIQISSTITAKPRDHSMKIEGFEKEENKKTGLQIVENYEQTEVAPAPQNVQDQQMVAPQPQSLQVQQEKPERPKFDEEKLKRISAEMDQRRKEWREQQKQKLDLNDVLEIRNPQSVIEFVTEIVFNLQKEELNHLYPVNFLDRNYQNEISDKYRQYLVDWLAELHYKFKMWPETLFVTVGIIDKTLKKWPNFKKTDLQCLGITALHIAGKYEEIYPPELKTILQVIDNAVTREQVCSMEAQILSKLDFDMVWPSLFRFMQRYACISNFSADQHMIAQMFCDFVLLNTSLLQHKPSLLGAVAIYATNKISNRRNPWNAQLRKCTLGYTEEDVKTIANELFYFVKKLESSSLKTMFRKYDLPDYLRVVQVLQKIQMPNSSSNAGQNQSQTPQSLRDDERSMRQPQDRTSKQQIQNQSGRQNQEMELQRIQDQLQPQDKNKKDDESRME